MGFSLKRSAKKAGKLLRDLDLGKPEARELLVKLIAARTGYPPELIDRVLRLAKDAVEGRL